MDHVKNGTGSMVLRASEHGVQARERRISAQRFLLKVMVTRMLKSTVVSFQNGSKKEKIAYLPQSDCPYMQASRPRVGSVRKWWR